VQVSHAELKKMFGMKTGKDTGGGDTNKSLKLKPQTGALCVDGHQHHWQNNEKAVCGALLSCYC
jgi:hypothetical protein